MTLTVAGLVVAVVAAMLLGDGHRGRRGVVLVGAYRFFAYRGADAGGLDSKNEAAHAGIVTRVDALAHDVAFLAGRQKERNQRANRPDEGQ